MNIAKPQRVFFALWPSVDTAAVLRERADALGLAGRPVAAERLHLTLAFHGRCQPETITRLAERAARVEVPALMLGFDRVGFFSRSQTVWLGASEPPTAVYELAEYLAGDELVDRQAFKPHITVARRAERPTAGSIRPVCATFDSFTLTASGDGGGPGVYHTIGRWSLGAVDDATLV